MEADTLREDIANAITEINDKPEVVDSPVVEPSEEKPVLDGRDDKGRFKAKEADLVKPAETDVKPVVEEPPQALSAAVKAKWATLDAETRQEFIKREADVNKMFHNKDGELQMGRELKEVITPYMAIIQAEGGTPASAVKDLLNTAYQLRSAQPAQKAQLVQRIIQQYGVDMSLVQEQSADTTIQSLQQKIAQIEQMANPEAMYRKFEEKSENSRILSEVSAFASDPANKHYEQVKPLMAKLLGSGASQSMKEAYDAACKLDPTISSILEAEKVSSLKVKQAEEIGKKRNAGASITGSPGAIVPNTGAPDRSLREELQANLRAHSS